MRPTVIAGNWKMNKDIHETRKLIREILDQSKQINSSVRVILCPPFTSLTVASELLQGTLIHLGAQNMSEHDDGAYTGEVSWKMLKSVGCSYVILGHSERRQYYAETDALISRKVKKALMAGLTPIVCVGETLEQREQGSAFSVVSEQVTTVLESIPSEQIEEVIIAYEPVWAIGTGRNATPDQAQEMHMFIRGTIEQAHGELVGRNLVIQYGGSVKPENASEILSQPDVDGALVGGACLVPKSFLEIIRSASA
jgi:triosephosphate isomerase